LQPDGGVLFAGECWRAFLALATGTGAVIMPHTRARAIGERSWGVRVETGSGTLDADLAVVAAAGWSGELLKPLGLDVPLTITAEHVGYYPLRSGVSLLPFIWHDPAARQLFYGLPDGSGPWLKAGEHGAGPIVDSETEVYPEPARLEAIDRLVDALLPGAEPSRVEGHTCLYAATPDDDFVLDRAGPIMLAAGFGGHGFKFAPLIGELVAALALGDASAIPSRFALKRFDRVRSRLPMVPGQG
jgi:sarcosine oxidase